MRRFPRDFEIVVLATILAASVLLWYLSPEIKWENWLELLLFVALIGAASMFPIPDPRGGYITVTPILFYVLFSIHGPGAGILIAGSAYAVGGAISRGWVPWRTLFSGAQIGISVGLAGVAFRAVGGSVISPSIRSFLLPFILGALVHQASNNFFVALFFSRLRRQPLLATWLSDLKDLLWSNSLVVSSAALFAILYVSVHPAILLLYLTSLPLQKWALQLYLQQKRLYWQAIDSLVVAIDADFPEGRGHSKQVAEVAMGIAKELNLPEGELEVIEMSALLHDVGMIGLDDYVAETSKLPSLDDSRLHAHVRLGNEVARQLPRRGQDIAEIILSHHERYDGSGYPQGLIGVDIPLGARIVGLAEAYETMIASGSVSGSRVSPAQAVAIIKEQSGTVFDPVVVRAFLSALEEGGIAQGSRVIGEATT